MDLPFILTEGRDGTLRYGIALWYRVLAALILGILTGALTVQGEPPSIVGWLFLALSALGVLYEERWSFRRDGVEHASGLIFAPRRLKLPRESLDVLRLVAHIRGAIPGSEDEAAWKSRALSGETETNHYGKKNALWKRPYLILVLVARDGTEYAIDKVPARNLERIRRTAMRIGQRIGLELDASSGAWGA